MKKLSVLLAAAALLSLQASPIFAQGAAVPPAQQTGNPSGLDPTASAPTEKQLLDALQGGRLEGRVSIPDQKSRVLEQPEGRTVPDVPGRLAAVDRRRLHSRNARPARHVFLRPRTHHA